MQKNENIFYYCLNCIDNVCIFIVVSAHYVYYRGYMDKLDKYEQDLEDNYESFESVPNVVELKKQLRMAAKSHISDKKPITIRVSTNDIEAIKIKASKCGIPYQTYLNMVIHKEASAV